MWGKADSSWVRTQQVWSRMLAIVKQAEEHRKKRKKKIMLLPGVLHHSHLCPLILEILCVVAK